ncbi:trafficking protein particle complex subunit 6b-like isoform X1 [Artemia franciscana]|uniref:trafficking protein particle complex subunit 6b-like isoform X1 n=1 Tax=Artemia franciscana TaxID=6661 RepID=UPI0032DA8010
MLGTCEDTLFELFHGAIVSTILKDATAEEEIDERISKLEYIGFSSGLRLAERFTRDLPRFKDELDIIKFLCKDFWTAVFKKQVDNLRTNHQGVYVLQDSKFRMLEKVSNGRQYLDKSSRLLVYTCGLIRGWLAALNVPCVVTAEVISMPACKFHIHLQRSS